MSLKKCCIGYIGRFDQTQTNNIVKFDKPFVKFYYDEWQCFHISHIQARKTEHNYPKASGWIFRLFNNFIHKICCYDSLTLSVITYDYYVDIEKNDVIIDRKYNSGLGYIKHLINPIINRSREWLFQKAGKFNQ